MIKMGILDYLQKSHAIDVLLALSPSEEEPYVGWKAVSIRLRKQDIICSDGTYRARCKELVDLGLAQADQIDPLKFDYVLTKKGIIVAGILRKCLWEIRALKES